MRGAIIGDIVGSRFEGEPYKGTDFDLFGNDRLTTSECRYTDDTVMTVAVADALLKHDPHQAEEFKAGLQSCIHALGHAHLDAGFGYWQYEWIKYEKTEPYNSFGNGSAMRVSPVGWYATSLEEAERIAKMTAEITHDHPEGIKGAQAVAACIWLARNEASKPEILRYVEQTYYPEITGIKLEELRPSYEFDVTCQGSVPVSIAAFLESESYEDAIKLAVSMGGDSDTMTCIAGSIAEAFYGLPYDLWERAAKALSDDLLMIVDCFVSRYVEQDDRLVHTSEHTDEDIFQAVIETVAATFDVDIEDLLIPNRTHNVRSARQLAIYLYREATNAHFVDIARTFKMDPLPVADVVLRFVPDKLEDAEYLKKAQSALQPLILEGIIKNNVFE